MEDYAKLLRDKGYEIMDAQADGAYTIAGGLKKDGADVVTVIIGLQNDTGVCGYVLSISTVK